VSASQGVFRRQWSLPWQETQHRVALTQRLPKGRATSIVGGVAVLGKGLPFPAYCALPTMLVARLNVTELSAWPTKCNLKAAFLGATSARGNPFIDRSISEPSSENNLPLKRKRLPGTTWASCSRACNAPNRSLKKSAESDSLARVSADLLTGVGELGACRRRRRGAPIFSIYNFLIWSYRINSKPRTADGPPQATFEV
jgi:hypothetical protein